MPADLHCHTRLSDGSLGIEDLILLASRSGIDTIAITDHDCQAGTVRGKIIGKRHGVEVIPGVELSSYDPEHDMNISILCYLAENPNRLEGLCRKNSLARRKASQLMVVKASQRFPISSELVLKCASGSTNIYKQHIMHALMDAGYADGFYGETYDKLFNPETGCACVATQYPSVREVIDLIHSAGGLTVLAHPYTYDSTDLMQELVGSGLLDGVEVWHPRNTEEQRVQLQDFAKAHDMLMTGGSDFHGMYTSKPRPLGCCSAPDETVQLMKDYKYKHGR